ncbi:MAG: DUF1993 domain-containing protein [Gammaproteobacteria bacterium]|nr:DUF1993 domain-containing protein [Gammaproteobacteria bacterium]
MPISMYQASLPPLIHMLKNLKTVLKKGAVSAEARKIDPKVLVDARLFPDMYPLSRQVQIASDVAKGCGARLAGIEPPKFEDKESTFDELIARVDKTLKFLAGLKAKQIDASEGRTITLKFPSMTLDFTARDYLQNFVITNFYFHVSMAYAILRHNGVEIGKRDYLGGGPRPQRRKVSKKKKR